LPWAASSPDMNIIENAWAYLDRKVRERYPLPTNPDQLWAALEEKWRKLDLGYVQRLDESMPGRVADLIDAEGLWTDH
ncbi:hypothetical protein PYCCODRAFT_1360776, partial [Trametes coccinea BRFM310]